MLNIWRRGLNLKKSKWTSSDNIVTVKNRVPINWRIT